MYSAAENFEKSFFRFGRQKIILIRLIIVDSSKNKERK